MGPGHRRVRKAVHRRCECRWIHGSGVDVGDPKILEKGENNLRRVVGGRIGEFRLEINAADPNHGPI